MYSLSNACTNCQISSAICQISFAICQISYAICQISSAICHCSVKVNTQLRSMINFSSRPEAQWCPDLGSGQPVAGLPVDRASPRSAPSPGGHPDPPDLLPAGLVVPGHQVGLLPVLPWQVPHDHHHGLWGHDRRWAKLTQTETQYLIGFSELMFFGFYLDNIYRLLFSCPEQRLVLLLFKFLNKHISWLKKNIGPLRHPDNSMLMDDND